MKMRLIILLALVVTAFEAQASDPANALFDCSTEKSRLYIVSSESTSGVAEGVTIGEGVTRISKFLADKAPDLYLVNERGQREKLNFTVPMGKGYPFGVWRGNEVDFDLLKDEVSVDDGSLSLAFRHRSRTILIERSTNKKIDCTPAQAFRVDCC